MTQLPTSTVTLLMTDVEGSTEAWERDHAGMLAAMERHHRVARALIRQYGGVLPRDQGEGDSLLVAFDRATEAVHAALSLQVLLHKDFSSGRLPFQVRMGLHTGEVDVVESNYRGVAVSRAARVRGHAAGGQVVLSSVTASLVRDRLPEGARLVDLGEHQLKGLTAPERIFQLAHPSLPDAGFAGSPVASDDRPLGDSNVPRPLTSFVGREADLAAVTELLAQHRLVTLTGPGGVGKTRLAQELGTQELATFSDGVRFAPLVDVRDPALVDAAVAAAVGADSGGLALHAIASYVGHSHLLLVIDGCEHLARTVAELVLPLLAACPKLRVVVTARAPLDVPGEQVWPVGPLPVDDEALQLFADRARTRLPSFSLDDATRAAVGRIARRLDGLPLALELAAARVAVLDTADLADRLDRDLAMLDAPLRSMLDWSRGLLSAEEQLLWDRLAVFSGGATLAAVEAVCADDQLAPAQVLDVLAALVAKSLVVTDRRAGSVRYGLLETMREYAAGHLAARPDADEIGRRHVSFFAGLPDEELASEQANLRAAVRRAAADGDPRVGALASALARVWPEFEQWATEGSGLYWLPPRDAAPGDAG